MPTLGAFIQYLPRAFAGACYRGTDATVYAIVEGKGRTTIGDLTFGWGPRDIFAVPSWAPVRHIVESDAVLFSMSDRPAQIALGLWREEAPMS